MNRAVENNIDSLIGFAATEWGGFSTTKGGEGGDIIEVTSGTQLNTILLARKNPHFNENYPPLVLILRGTLTFLEDEMMDVKETRNLSILGDGTGSVIEGFGLNIYKSHNIIIRNIEFRDCPDDAISIDDVTTHHIWIDHCTFSDSPDFDPDAHRHDGLVDIKHGANYITISWNYFYNHKKTSLLGHSDNNAAVDIGRLKVTYHHNWFDNTYSRHPRVRFGECHVFNNFYDNSQGGMDYGIGSTEEADVVVEANYFKNVVHPMYVGYGSSSEGDIVEFNNTYENCGIPETRGDAFTPDAYYIYDPEPSIDIPSIVMAGSGVGKIVIEVPSVIDNEKNRMVHTFSLHQNYPNPFNPSTTIKYDLTKHSKVILEIYNLFGRRMETLVNNCQPAGKHEINWIPYGLSSGIYFSRLQVEDLSTDSPQRLTEIRKLILQK